MRHHLLFLCKFKDHGEFQGHFASKKASRRGGEGSGIAYGPECGIIQVATARGLCNLQGPYTAFWGNDKAYHDLSFYLTQSRRVRVLFYLSTWNLTMSK